MVVLSIEFSDVAHPHWFLVA